MGIKARPALEATGVLGFWAGLGVLYPDSKSGLSSWLAIAHAPQLGLSTLAWAAAPLAVATGWPLPLCQQLLSFSASKMGWVSLESSLQSPLWVLDHFLANA